MDVEDILTQASQSQCCSPNPCLWLGPFACWDQHGSTPVVESAFRCDGKWYKGLLVGALGRNAFPATQPKPRSVPSHDRMDLISLRVNVLARIIEQ